MCGGTDLAGESRRALTAEPTLRSVARSRGVFQLVTSQAITL